MEYNCRAVQRDTANKGNAMRLINELLEPKGETERTTEYITAPLNVTDGEVMDPERLAALTAAPADMAIQMPANAAWWASGRGEAAERR